MTRTQKLATATFASIACAAFALAPGTASAQEGAELFKAKTCVTCHGEDAKTSLIPDYPKLAGQNKSYLANQMRDIKSGARSNGQSAVMKAIMTLVADEEIDKLAEYISGLTP